MTPEFKTKFNILKEIIEIFNQRCTCNGVDLKVSFKFISEIRNFDPNSDLWLATLSSDVFGNERYGGSLERVVELVNNYILTLADQLLESMVANSNEWYNDKQHLIVRIFELHNTIKALYHG